MFRPRFLPDNFTLALVATVALASVWPARGALGADFETLTAVAIGLLFFLHGAKLSREAIIAGATHWRLHLLVLASTFVLFPVLGLALKPLLAPLVTPQLYLGVLFLCMLPATVQSAIAFTSIARGNVAAAVCSASASTLIGIFITPVLVSLFVVPHRAGAASAWSSIGHIMLQLMAPFVAGQLLRGWIHPWLARHGGALKFVDQGSILLVVYTAFSAAVVQGLWKQVSFSSLAGLLGVCAVLLALMLGLTGWSAPARLYEGRRNHHRVLRLQEKPGQRHSDGQGAVCLGRRGCRRAAADAVSPDPVDGLRGAGPALRPACARGVRAGRGGHTLALRRRRRSLRARACFSCGGCLGPARRS
jgi:sodium/bile acid cotransporter 7